MMKIHSDNGSPTRCPFSNYRSRSILEYLKLWWRKKNLGVQEKEAKYLRRPKTIRGPTIC